MKENSPPLGILDQAVPHQPAQPQTAEEAALLHLAEWSTNRQPLSSRGVFPSSSLSSHPHVSQRHPFILIRDTPSPVSVITISSDSEDEGDGLRARACHNRHHRHHHRLPATTEHHQSDRFLHVKNNEQITSESLTHSGRYPRRWKLDELNNKIFS